MLAIHKDIPLHCWKVITLPGGSSQTICYNNNGLIYDVPIWKLTNPQSLAQWLTHLRTKDWFRQTEDQFWYAMREAKCPTIVATSKPHDEQPEPTCSRVTAEAPMRRGTLMETPKSKYVGPIVTKEEYEAALAELDKNPSDLGTWGSHMGTAMFYEIAHGIEPDSFTKIITRDRDAEGTRETKRK